MRVNVSGEVILIKQALKVCMLAACKYTYTWDWRGTYALLWQMTQYQVFVVRVYGKIAKFPLFK